jgi:dienelactone hydrolase
MTTPAMEKLGEPMVSRGVAEQRFDTTCEGRTVPAILWHPEGAEDAGPAPLVLLGHGGTAHKRVEYLLAVARWLAAKHGIASLSIDALVHGDRRGPEQDPDDVRDDFLESWKRPETPDEMIRDFQAALAAVETELSVGPLGYFGFSMGTMMGVPLIAAEPRIKAAVIGLMGPWGSVATRIRKDAPSVTCPVRFLMQWDDELIDRDLCFELFDLLGSGDKHLRAHPGLHAEVPAGEMREAPGWLAAHLS